MPGDPRPSKVPAHRFEQDDEVPPDHFGRHWCKHCRLPGHVGDERHPAGAPPAQSTVLPPAPPGATEFDTRRLGEHPEEEAA